jgi:hypothetical protein
MDMPSRYEIWHGRDAPPPERIPLRAGPLAVEFEGGDLRYLRLGEKELVRRVYVAIRDHNWNTIPGVISDLSISALADSFTIAFAVSHRAGPLQFSWRGTITGDSAGLIRVAMDGVAGSAFRYCRIGFCVLHPIREYAGRPYRAQTPAGPVTGELPLLIGPQLVEGGFEAPLFPSFSRLAVPLEGGPEVAHEFEGELFEMEDQRNWTDGSFKTYCTPLALGYPKQAEAGQTFRQAVIIRAAPLPATADPAGVQHPDAVTRLTLGPSLGHGLPAIGFGIGAGSGPDGALSPSEAALLAGARPAHLRAEVRFRETGWRESLERALAVARQVGTRLELALFLDGDAAAASASLASLTARLAGAPLARVLVFHEPEAAQAATAPQWVQAARRALGGAFPGLPIGGGTNGNFAELHRAWPDVSGMDCVSFTLNPQVHATDERSLIEAIEGQESTIRTARARVGRLPVCVSPVTLKPPFNQAATEAEAPPDPSVLPPSVDPRQMSLFGAAWTVGSLRALGEAGADSVTYYETTGWRGLLETERGAALPDRFPSRPGMLFPVYHVFADLAEFEGAEAAATHSSDPLRAQGLALSAAGRVHLLVANLLPRAQRVSIGPLPAGALALRRLNEETAHAAMFQPHRFREPLESSPFAGGELVVELAPYETAFLDVREAPR